jgi:hydroxypyruvate isomerase
MRNAIEATAAARFPNVICFSGNRTAKMTDAEGLRNCTRGLKKVMRLAEKKKVTICMELLNSKVNHPRYMCDSMEWGAELVRRVGSEWFKLLYDVYHMQVQEGNIIASIRKYSPIIGHYHTAGVPGRGEFDETQELNYPAIMRAIAQTGFDGFVAHEFIPTGDALLCLRRAVTACTL